MSFEISNSSSYLELKNKTLKVSKPNEVSFFIVISIFYDL